MARYRVINLTTSTLALPTDNPKYAHEIARRIAKNDGHTTIICETKFMYERSVKKTKGY